MAMHVGLFVVRFKFVLNISHLSEWFIFFLIISCLYVVVRSSFTIAVNGLKRYKGLQLLGFLALNLI